MGRHRGGVCRHQMMRNGGVLMPIEKLLEEGKYLTPDMGGTATTSQVTDRLLELL